MTLREGNNSDSSDSRKTFITLMFDFLCRVFWIFFFLFFFFLSPSIVVVNFIGTIKSN